MHLAFDRALLHDPIRVYAPVGDFDGDGRADVFSLTNNNGKYSWEISSGAQQPWQVLGQAYNSSTAIGFGDFDGDGRTDVFFTGRDSWYFVPGGASKPVPLLGFKQPIEGIRFGDFDGDGRTDLFHIDVNGVWQFASAGQKGWTAINKLGGAVDDYLFGDFDGDKRTDVFRVGERGQWQYSPGATGAWKGLASQGMSVTALKAADMNGDGRTDIFTASGGQWMVSLGGNGKWISVFKSPAPLSDIHLVDIEGDRRADVFVANRSKDEITWSYVDDAATGWKKLFSYSVLAEEPQPTPEPTPEPAPEPAPEPTPQPAPSTGPGGGLATPPMPPPPGTFSRVLAPGRCTLTPAQINTCSAASGWTQQRIAEQVNHTQGNLAISCCRAISEAETKYGSPSCNVVRSDVKTAFGCSE